MSQVINLDALLATGGDSRDQFKRDMAQPADLQLADELPSVRLQKRRIGAARQEGPAVGCHASLGAGKLQ